jgi:hypothetical protein
MSDIPSPKFRKGEVAILQPPHPSARHLWGQETTILRLFWSADGNDAMGGFTSNWCYKTDVPAPPPSDLPEDQHDGWVWCEYDLRKKHEAGEDFASVMAAFSREKVGV